MGDHTEMIDLIGFGAVYDILLDASLHFSGLLTGRHAALISIVVAFYIPFAVFCCAPTVFIDHFTPWLFKLVILCSTLLFAWGLYHHFHLLFLA